VENEKLRQEVEGLVAVVSGLEAVAKDKEERFRQVEQRLAGELKEARERLITLGSELELEVFVHKQMEEQLQAVRETAT